jgi:hypothetical protein
MLAVPAQSTDGLPMTSKETTVKPARTTLSEAINISPTNTTSLANLEKRISNNPFANTKRLLSVDYKRFSSSFLRRGQYIYDF